jgi:ParB-like partition proteins
MPGDKTFTPGGGKSILEQIKEQPNTESRLDGVTSTAAQAAVFDTLVSPQQMTPENIINIPVDMLDVFYDQTYSIPTDTEDFAQLKSSIEKFGVQEPLLVRQKEKATPFAPDRFEIISGHRRWTISKLLGLPTVPAIVKELDDIHAQAIEILSNIKREDIPIVERADACRKLVDAYLKGAGRPGKINLSQGGTNYDARKQAAEELGIARGTLDRYLRILKLSPALKEKVNDKALGVVPAVQLSHLSEEIQSSVAEVLEQNSGAAITEDKAKKLRELAEADGTLATDIVRKVIITGTDEEKPRKPALPKNRKLVKSNLSNLGKHIANVEVEIDEETLEMVNGLIEQIHQVLKTT